MDEYIERYRPFGLSRKDKKQKKGVYDYFYLNKDNNLVGIWKDKEGKIVNFIPSKFKFNIGELSPLYLLFYRYLTRKDLDDDEFIKLIHTDYQNGYNDKDGFVNLKETFKYTKRNNFDTIRFDY